MPTILGANSVSSGYEISNSMRFNRGDAACLRKTFSGSPTSTKKCTISFWTKLADPFNTDAKAIFSAIKSGVNEDVIKFMGVNNGILNSLEINFNNTNGGTMMVSSGNSTLIKFRDPAAWYHFVIAIDSSQGTASNRVKVYVNGTQFDVEARVEGGSITDDVVLTQDYELGFLIASAHSIGENVESAGNEPYDGYLADFYFVDGQQYAPTVFGETDDNGVWIPKEAKDDISFGNYGFFLEFQGTGTSADASGKGADTSGNDNHFDDANATAEDITTDTPTNNFATMNPLESDRQQGGAATFAEGNLQITTSYVDANYQRYPQVYSTQAVSSGKWYFEMKISTSDVDSSIGIFSPDNHASDSTTNPYGGYATTGCIFTDRGSVRINDGQTTGLGTWSQNDIVGCALDIDNDKVYFHRNGTYVQSGDPAGNSGGQAIPSNTTYGFSVGCDKPSDSGTMQVNFGNPIYTISSGNTDGKYGNFEYAVPSGFYAVCTKRLAEFG